MPPARRSRTSGGPAIKGSQKTLTFNSSKITKPSSAKDNLTTPPPSKPIDTEPASPEAAEAVTAPSPSPQQEEEEEQRTQPTAAPVADDDDDTTKLNLNLKLQQARTPEEARAERVTSAQINRYWRAQEAERRAPRVHQEDLGVEEKILRLFDMSSQYGPCIGMPRMKRWLRAQKLGLTPPIEVLAVLMREEERGNAGIEKAHVDELMSSKLVAGEA